MEKHQKQCAITTTLKFYQNSQSQLLEIINIAKQISGEELSIKRDKRRIGDPPNLVADASKAAKELNWKPTKTLNEIVAEMIEEDSNEAKKESLLKKKGFSIYSSQE